MEMTNWKTEEMASQMEEIREKCTQSFFTEDKECIVLKPHANFTTTDERALSAFVDYSSKKRQLVEGYKEELERGDVDERELRERVQKEYDGLVVAYHEAFRKGFGEDVECVIHLDKNAVRYNESGKIELRIEAYPIKADGTTYDVVELDFIGEDDESEVNTRPCLILEVKDIEG